ncbi:unnamed protein product, partial [Ectocarpus sp. 8 AP-2014]
MSADLAELAAFEDELEHSNDELVEGAMATLDIEREEALHLFDSGIYYTADADSMLGSIGVLGSPAEQEAWGKNPDELRAQKGRQVMRDFLKIRGGKNGRSKNGLLACKLLGHYAKLVLVSTAATPAVGDAIAEAWDQPCTGFASLIELCSFLTGGTVEERAPIVKTLVDGTRGMGKSWLRRAKRALNALSKAGHTSGTVLCLRGE